MAITVLIVWSVTYLFVSQLFQYPCIFNELYIRILFSVLFAMIHFIMILKRYMGALCDINHW